MSDKTALIGRLPITPGGTDYQAAYDDALNITWVTNGTLSSANTWDNQVAWANSLNTSGYLGFNAGWRLASMSVTAGLPTGITDSVFNCGTSPTTTELACRDNELGYMYTHNLGRISAPYATGDQIIGDVTLTGIQQVYWSGASHGILPNDTSWMLVFGNGTQGYSGRHNDAFYGWAVRGGDIGAVPVPATVWLFGSGLLGLVGMAIRKTPHQEIQRLIFIDNSLACPDKRHYPHNTHNRPQIWFWRQYD